MKGEALPGRRRVSGSWRGDSLEVTFCSVTKRSLILALGDSGVLVVRYFTRVRSSAPFGTG